MDPKDSSPEHISCKVPQLFPSMGPVLLISMGYIDPGKWAAAVDGGARFGFGLILLVLAFNCIAILCQYVSVRVSLATGKNLSQICREEYNQPMCILLGFLAELSVIALELTTIIGISHGLNLLFGLDLCICILLTATDAVLFPFLTTLLGKCRTENLLISMAALAFLLYALQIFSSQLEIPFVINEIFPKFRGESAYVIMSLLGASIMPHNFYLHSSIIQQQQQWKKLPSISMHALCHDHFFAITCIFSIIFLVNSVVMLSAATQFHNVGVAATFQDVIFLMDEIFWRPKAHFALFLVLFFSSLVTTLTWNVGGQNLLHDFYGIHPPVWVHRAMVKALAVVPLLFCAWNSGAEGVYQLLIFSQVLLALLLPSSVIPLFRIASSGPIMGALKISCFMELLALLAFFGMLVSNICFIIEMLFGDADWHGWHICDGTSFSYFFLLLVSSASSALMLWLAATPLKSSRTNPHMQMSSLDLKRELPDPSEHGEGNELNSIKFDEEKDSIKQIYDGEKEPMVDDMPLEKSVLRSSDNSFPESGLDLPETIVETEYSPPQFPAYVENHATVSNSSSSHTELSTPAAKQLPVADMSEASPGGLLDASASRKADLDDFVPDSGVEDVVEKSGMEVDVRSTVKDDDDVDAWEPDESPVGASGSVSSSTYEGPGSFRSVIGKSDDGGSGSLSRLSGLGRAARRQLAAVLVEFWGLLYDSHGTVTEDAKAKKFDLILGFELKSVVSAVKADAAGAEFDRRHVSEAESGSTLFTNLRDYSSLTQQRIDNITSSGVQAGISSWSSYVDSLHAYVQNCRLNQLNANQRQLNGNERRYSSLRLPSYAEDRDYQPATIHGCHMSAYLSRIVADKSTDSFSIPQGPSTPKSASNLPNYRNPLSSNPGLNRLSSLHALSVQNPSLPAVSGLHVERGPYYDASLVGSSGDFESSVYPKKYHSLPDISGLVISNRNPSLANRNTQLNNPIGPRLSTGRMPYEQPLYPVSSRPQGVPLAFDELSPSKHYKDSFSMPVNSNLDGRSLWSRQPFEQLFGIAGKPRNGGHGLPENTVLLAEAESLLIQSFRHCILKLLKLEGSDWLFRQSGGLDEDLIEQVAAKERLLYEADGRDRANVNDHSYRSFDGKLLWSEEACLSPFESPWMPRCGDSCIWHVGLIVSFGVWCIRRILELSVIESRPELWGKYTYVLNRLQGILDPAFFKPRQLISPCSCLQIPSIHARRSGLPLPNGLSPAGKASRGRFTTAGMLLDLIKVVEAAVSGRKGRTGTAAGEVAYPKGKENLASVLKRYKRRLSNKPPGAHDGGSGPRKIPIPTTSFMQ